MTDHPITPPPDLIQEWIDEPQYMTEGLIGKRMTMISMNEVKFREIIDKASQYGADRELDACCEWLDTEKILTKDGGYIRKLRAARRPRPLSLKEQALEVFETLIHGDATGLDVGVVRRALEALDD